MPRLLSSNSSFLLLPLLLLILLFLLLTHVQPIAAQPYCSGTTCAPDTSSNCLACNASSTLCQRAWYGQPGYSCGTAVGHPTTGRDMYYPNCCPQSYAGWAYQCAPLNYTTVSAGVTYAVDGFGCVRPKSSMGAATIVAITMCGVGVCLTVAVITYLTHRRRRLAAAMAIESPLLPASDEDGGYAAPLLHSQAMQPFSSQPYNLDMQQPYDAPAHNVRAEHSQPQPM